MKILDVLVKVNYSLLYRLKVRSRKLILLDAAIVFKCLYGSKNDNRIRGDSSLAALDVDELLCSEVSAEACLRHNVVCHLECSLCRSHAVAAVSDVGKRSTVNKCRSSLECLNHVRLYRIL